MRGDGGHVHAALGQRHAHALGDVAHRLHRVARDDVDAHTLLVEVLERLRGGEAHTVPDEDQGQGLHGAHDDVLLVEALHLRQHQHAAHAGQAGDGVLYSRQLRVPLEQELRRADRVGACIGAVDHAGVLVLGGEGHDARLALNGRGSVGALLEVGDVAVYGLGGLVGARLVDHRVQRHQGMQGVEVLPALQGDELVDLHLAGGDGAGLVKADHVHTGERLHAVELLHQHLVLRQAHHAHGQHARGEEDEALGDHAHQRRAGVQDGLLQRAAGPDDLLHHQQRAQGHDGDGDPLHDAPEGVHDVARGLAVDLGLVVDAGGVVVRAHRGDLRAAAACSDEAAGEELVAGGLGDEVALAREQALVHRGLALHHAAVAGHLVSAVEDHKVVEDDVVERDVAAEAIAHHMRLGGGDDGELVDGALAADLLEDADGDVAEDDAHEEHVGVGTRPKDRRGDDDVDQVEQGADVVAHDLGYRLGAHVGVGVDLAGCHALAHLLGAQALGRSDEGGCRGAGGGGLLLHGLLSVLTRFFACMTA